MTVSNDTPDTPEPVPPPGLGARGRRFWADTLAVYDLTDGELALLTEVCRTLDNLDALAEVLAADGATTVGSQGQLVVHPALTESRGLRLTLHRLLAALALPDEDGGSMPTARQVAGRMNAEGQWSGKLTEASQRRWAGA